MNRRMQFTPAVKTLGGLINEVKNVTRYGLDLQPKYQREYIWKDDFKDKLIYSIVRGYPIGSISIGVLNEPNEKKAMSEVVDGQQRLTTIYNFVQENYEIKHEYARKISEDVLDYLNELEDDKELNALRKKVSDSKRFKLTYKMLPEIIKNNIQSYQLSISNISEATRDQIAEYFRFLQNQEILRAGEIINVLPETRFENYLKRLDDKEKFMKVIGYKDDKRRDFDKIFYCSIGILGGSLPFGATDTMIKKYIANSSGVLGEKTQQRVDTMIDKMNEITQLKENCISSTNKRYLKLLLLLLGFDRFSFSTGSMEVSLLKLLAVDKRLTSFSSAKKNIVKDTFTIFEPVGNIESIIEDYRLIALFTKGIQVYSTTVERIELLHAILERELSAQHLTEGNDS